MSRDFSWGGENRNNWKAKVGEDAGRFASSEMGWEWNEEKVWNGCKIRKRFGIGVKKRRRFRIGEGGAWENQGIWELTPKTPKLAHPPKD